MTQSALFVFTACAGAFSLHILTVVILLVRCSRKPDYRPVASSTPSISIIRPLQGVENFLDETLTSSLKLQYPNYEVIFCVADEADPVIPLLRAVIARHPYVRTQVLIGNESISGNPKLDNCFKGWNSAANDWIVFADSNVLMPKDYLQCLLNAWQANTGLVSAPPAGSRPLGLWANVECALLNGYQARWQYSADSIGLGFAQGKNMLCKREMLEAAGGLRVLGKELGEDAAFTKITRAAGLRVHLVDLPFPQPLGRRTAMEVWQRQVRWARIRRASFPGIFISEILTSTMLPLCCGVWLAAQFQLPLLLSAIVLVTAWYGAEMLVARAANWPLSGAYPLYAAIRDIILPMLWLAGWQRGDLIWRGKSLRVDENTRTDTPSATLSQVTT